MFGSNLFIHEFLTLSILQTYLLISVVSTRAILWTYQSSKIYYQINQRNNEHLNRVEKVACKGSFKTVLFCWLCVIFTASISELTHNFMHQPSRLEVIFLGKTFSLYFSQ